MGYARKSDGNAKEVASWFRGLGCSVGFMRSIHAGWPDILVGEPQTRSDHQVEVKPDGWRERNDDTAKAQLEHRQGWRGAEIERAITKQDVVDLVKKWRGK